MGLLESLKKRFSNTKASEQALRSRVKSAAADVQSENFQAAQDQLLDVLNRRNEIVDRGLVRLALQCLGATWYLQDQYADGIEFFTTYIEHHPADADGYSQRGMMFWYSGEYQKAVQDYTRSLELLPNDLFALSCRGQVLGELNQYQEALLDLDRASKALDQHQTANLAWRRRSQAYLHNGRGAAIAGLGKFDDGLREFETSITLCPNNAWVYYKRAFAYDSRGEHQKAISDYQLALVKKDPKLPLNKSRYAEARLQALRQS
jgi:tetratricopeptide (TPR) repeat protein